MELIDITKELSEETVVYRGDPKVRIEELKTVPKDGYALSKVSMGLHSGTHIENPSHYFEGGNESFEAFIREARVLCLEELENLSIKKGDFLLLKSGVGLSERIADALLEAEISGIGTDSLSVGNEEVHKKLLGRGATIVENLKLSDVKDGRYLFYCFPLKLKGTEAAPCRCALTKI